MGPILNEGLIMYGFYIRKGTVSSQRSLAILIFLENKRTKDMKAEFLGGARTVTGSATRLSKRSLQWLVDCGMYQGGRKVEARNHDLGPYGARDLSFLLLTHAHIDHCGLIPKLVREGFRGKMICTRATRDLAEIMLRDSAHIQAMETEWQTRKNKRSGKKETSPLYTLEDMEASLKLFEPARYEEMLPLGDGVKARFQDAGHILGSAIIELWVEEGEQERKLVFSGDLGNTHQPIVRDPAWIEEGDFLWLESTYGNRLHKPREETTQELLGIIREAIQNHAKVVIPAFAVERTQDVIYTLSQFIRSGWIPSIPVYIDSPLAISATEIFKKNADCFDQETMEILSGGDNPFELPEIVYARTTEESKAINEDPGPGIIISASGMCDSGRIKHHLKHHLWRPESHIVIIGYQAEGTLGRILVEGAKAVKLFGEMISVKARIHTLGGFSAHADQNGLLDWLSHFKNPDLKVFVVHGEENVSLELSESIRRRFGFEAIVPQWREKRDLLGIEAPEIPGRPVVREVAAPAPPSAGELAPLLKSLDHSYKKLRRKLKRGGRKGKMGPEPRWIGELEEIRTKLEELESRVR
jgi:metallo-beta-lactamase family protein